MTSIFEDMESATRRIHFGRAGEYRKPASGRVEWRVPSNAWMCASGVLQLIGDISRWVMTLELQGLLKTCWQVSEEEARETINNCDIELARSLLKRNDAALKVLLNKVYRDKPISARIAHKVIMTGIKNYLDPQDVKTNWIFDHGSEVNDRDLGILSWTALALKIKGSD